MSDNILKFISRVWSVIIPLSPKSFIHITVTTVESFLYLDSSFDVWWCLTPLSTIFKLYVAVSFNGGGNWRTHRKPVASQWHTLSHNVVHLTLVEIRTNNISVVIGTDCIGSCKSNYHMITTTTDPILLWRA